MRRKVIQVFILISVFVALLIVLQYFRFGGLLGFVIFSDSTQGDFNNGSYLNAFNNGSAVVLSGTNLTGEYTSKIFNSSRASRWNNVSLVFSKNSLAKLFAADNSADFWNSLDYGVIWTKINDDYNGVESNGGDGFAINSSGTLFILHGQDIWSSTDSGVSWTKVNDDFNGAGDSSNGVVFGADVNNALVLIDAAESVWKSTNSGTSWTAVNTSDINGANGNIAGMAIDSNNNLFAVDAVSDVWKSTNSGTSWALVKDDYNAGAANGANGMLINGSNALFILDIQDIWSSTDSGVSWTKVNDDFNGAGDSNSGIVIGLSGNDIYIGDGSEDIYKSTDSGITFSRTIADFNGASAGIFGLGGFNYSSNILYQIRNCSSLDCSDGTFIGSDGTSNSYYTESFSALNKTGVYFQYKIYISRMDADAAPYLSGVDIDYSLLNTAPTVNIARPIDGGAINQNVSISLNFSASDGDNNLQACWYNLDSGINVSLVNCGNATFDASDGIHTINLYANDSEGAAGSDSTSFNISAVGVSVDITSPRGSKSTRTNVPITISAKGENLTCRYSVAFSSGATVIQNTSLLGCQNSFFNLSIDGDFIFDIYANNSMGISNSSSASFSVSSDGGGGGAGGSSSGGGGGGGGSIISFGGSKINVGVSGIEGMSINRGTEMAVTIGVLNLGAKFLNNCKVFVTGENYGWFGNSGIKGLSAGEKFDYILELSVPYDANAGAREFNLNVICDEGKYEKKFGIDVNAQIFGARIIDYEKDGNELKIYYSFAENKKDGGAISIEYVMIDKEGIIVTRGVGEAVFDDERYILSIALPKNAFGEFKLKMIFSEGALSEDVVKEIFLPSRGLTGFIAFGENNRWRLVFVLIVGLVALTFFSAKFIRKHHKRVSEHNFRRSAERKFIELDVGRIK